MDISLTLHLLDDLSFQNFLDQFDTYDLETLKNFYNQIIYDKRYSDTKIFLTKDKLNTLLTAYRLEKLNVPIKIKFDNALKNYLLSNNLNNEDEEYILSTNFEDEEKEEMFDFYVKFKSYEIKNFLDRHSETVKNSLFDIISKNKFDTNYIIAFISFIPYLSTQQFLNLKLKFFDELYKVMNAENDSYALSNLLRKNLALASYYDLNKIQKALDILNPDKTENEFSRSDYMDDIIGLIDNDSTLDRDYKDKVEDLYESIVINYN